MVRYSCKVLTPQGQVARLELNAEDKVSCIKRLKKNGMTPISVEEKHTISKHKKAEVTAKVKPKTKKKLDLNRSVIINRKVTPEQVRKFSEDYLLLKNASFTDSHALATIINNCENLELKGILKEIKNNVDNNEYMYKVMEKYPAIFPLVYTNLIKSGELSHNVENAFKHGISYLEDEEELNEKINKIIIPNVIIFAVIMVLLFITLIIGIPIIEKIFLENGSIAELPAVTRLLSRISRAILKYRNFCFLIIVLAIILFLRYINTEKGRYNVDYFIYKNKIFGRLLYLMDFSKIIRSLEISLSNKVRLQDALEISKNSISNTYMLDLIERGINNIYSGKSWIAPFEENGFMNNIVIEILRISTTEKGSMSVEKAIEYVDYEIDRQIDYLIKKLPEVSNVIVGITLFLFTLIVVIPCVQIYLGGYLFM